jgi:hypothetical protein
MRRSTNRAVMRRLMLCVSAAAIFWAPAPAQSPCQTWTLEPKFGPTVTNGNWLTSCEVFNDGTGEMLWVAGSNWATSNGAYNVGRWDGHNWFAAGALDADVVESLAVYDAGQGPRMYAGGIWPSGGHVIWRWENGSWIELGSGLTPGPLGGALVHTMLAYDPGSGSQLYVGGYFDGGSSFPGSPTVPSKGIIRWNGSHWSALGTGLTPVGGSNAPNVERMIVYDAGQGPELYVAGHFGSAGGVPAEWIARWNGTSWNSLGTGVNGQVVGFGVWNDGSGPKLYVSGLMTLAGGVPVSKVAIWDGTSWSAFPVTPAPPASVMILFDDGTGPALYSDGGLNFGGGVMGPVRYDGTRFTALGGGVNGPIHDMAVYDDLTPGSPHLYMVGDFTSVGGQIPSTNIARWTRCAGPIDFFCPGDQTYSRCPCVNYGHTGHGCENSAATGGALLEWAGTVTPDTLRLISSGELPSALTIFMQGDQVNTWGQYFAAGIRCTAGNLLRMFVTNASGGIANAPGAGNPLISARSAALGDPLTPGVVRLYQAYYRDPAGICGQSHNITNGVRVVW